MERGDRGWFADANPGTGQPYAGRIQVELGHNLVNMTIELGACVAQLRLPDGALLIGCWFVHIEGNQRTLANNPPLPAGYDEHTVQGLDQAPNLSFASSVP